MNVNKTKVTKEMYKKCMLPIYDPASFILVKGAGSRIWDQQGKEYIDFSGGIAVNSMGHCHPKLVQALAKQSRLVWHTSNVFINEPSLRLATKLVDSSFASHVFFANSGAEVNEAALKIARYYSIQKYSKKKTKIISFVNSFHGRTFFTVSVGGKKNYSKHFGPIPKDIIHLPFNDLNSVKNIIDKRVCAVIVELIQGEGGIIPATISFIQGLSVLCKKNDVVLILDEVQTGVGRTGTLFTYQQYGIIPDIVTIAKSLGGGFPIGALLTTSTIASVLKPGLHGTTYGGNPLACSVAETVLDFVNTPKILNGVKQRSQFFLNKLNEINNELKLFKHIRVIGLLIGLELYSKCNIEMKKIIRMCSDEGLIILSAGKNVIRLAPSLIISYKDIVQGMHYFFKALRKFKKLLISYNV